MKLPVKILLAVLPITLTAIGALGWWSYDVARQSLYDIQYNSMRTTLQRFVQDEVASAYHGQIVGELDDGRLKALQAANRESIRANGLEYLIVDLKNEVQWRVKPQAIMVYELSEWRDEAESLWADPKFVHWGRMEGVRGSNLWVGRYVPEWSWGVFVVSPEAALTVSLDEIRKLTLVISVLSALGVSGLLIIVLRRFFVVPVHRLQLASNTIASHRQAVTIPVSGNDEIAQLARRMEEMSVAIEQYRVQQEILQEDLTLQREQAQVTLSSIADGVVTTDVNGRVLFLNPAAEDMVGWGVADAYGQRSEDIFQLVDEETGVMRAPLVPEVLQADRVVQPEGNVALKTRDGKTLAVQMTAAPIRDTANSIIGAVLVFSDVSKAREMAEKLTYQATHDSLTGLVNRREFERRLRLLLDNYLEDGGDHVVAYVDLDQFKVVNDSCGHVAGDELLRQISRTIKEKVRRHDTLARLGGDEFGLILEGCSLENARNVFETIRQAVEDFTFSWSDRTFRVGASIGVVAVSQAMPEVPALLSAVDTACYAAKDAGRNCIYVYREDDEGLQKRKGDMRWLSVLENAMEEDRLVLYRQDIKAMAAPTLNGERFEVLLRMIDETGKVIPPGAFIPAAERYGYMVNLDRWVLSNTLDFYREHPQAAAKLELVSINISGQSLGQSSFLQFVQDHLAHSPLPAEKIAFEITETAAISNFSQAVDFIKSIKELGCRFALDDFGSGVSSFAYLKSLPVDYLKIDGAFIRDLLSDPVNLALVISINEIAHVLGMRTIGEFVENDEVAQTLAEVGVDYGQGYGLAKPRPLVGDDKGFRQSAE